MKKDRTETAYWNGWKMEVHFDGSYRMGSNTYTPNGTLCTPQKPLLEASFLWSESEYKNQMSFQEFVDKVLGNE